LFQVTKWHLNKSPAPYWFSISSRRFNFPGSQKQRYCRQRFFRTVGGWKLKQINCPLEECSPMSTEGLFLRLVNFFNFKNVILADDTELTNYGDTSSIKAAQKENNAICVIW